VGKRYPAIIRLWESAWAEFVPFLAFDREIRTVICTFTEQGHAGGDVMNVYVYG
jgi:transposase-like protein